MKESGGDGKERYNARPTGQSINGGEEAWS